MKNRIISLLVLASATLWAAHVGSVSAQNLKDDAPDRYTVQRGDTLWSISGRYLDKPWSWPQLWDMNKDQVRNPHRIYPGDILVLDRASGRLRVDTVRLSPSVRREDISQAVPTIQPGAINAFLSRPMIVSETELESSPRIMATEENRVAVGAGNIAFAKGLTKDKGLNWHIYRRGDKLVDPDSGATLGYAALYLGEARVRQFGDISRVEIVKSTQEIYTDDRLIPVGKELPQFAYVPRSPTAKVEGRVVSLQDNLWETGKYFVVALSKGTKDGVEIGHVLALHRSQNTARYNLRTSPLFGREGPGGSDARRTHYEERLTPRDGPVYPVTTPVNDADLANL
ncbi:MAG: LysM domain-containing protein, partial [Burkholderiales bacterium]